MILIFDQPAAMATPLGFKSTVVLADGWSIVSEPNTHKVTISHTSRTCELNISMENLLIRMKKAEQEGGYLDLRGIP